MVMTVVLAGFDGTSRVPGVSLGAVRLWERLAHVAGGRLAQPLVIDEESKSSAIWGKRLHQLASEHDVRLTLGGEHLISFPLLEALVAAQPGLKVVVLDAHHDAYDYPLLTHYSVFHYVRHELGLPTLIVGARHELERMPSGCELLPAQQALAAFDACIRRAREFVAGGPFYFSVDLDVLEPAFFGAVSDPVSGGFTLEHLTMFTRELLALKPRAMDIVEYNPLRDPSAEQLRRLDPFFAEVARWLG